MKCNACSGDNLTRALDLGSIPIAHRFRTTPETEGEPTHPMVLHLCDDCGLLQVVDPIPPEALYTDYNYCFSAWKPQPHMQDEAAWLLGLLGPKAPVLEIGSNDGAFLHTLEQAGVQTLIGIEPNPVACEQARRTGATIHNGFFDLALAKQLVSERGRLPAIASRQTVEHISDLTGLAEALRTLLTEDGVFLIEVPDFEVPMRFGDPSCLWEEHVNYFGEDVHRRWLGANGFAVEEEFGAIPSPAARSRSWRGARR